MESMNFDAIAAVYDDTRVIDDDCFNGALDFITARFPPSTHKQLFEPGIGTGRIAIPFAARGYDVTGVDISAEMLRRLSDKLRQQSAPSVKFHQADVTRLPFPDNAYDIAVGVHIFHLVRNWRKAMSEVFRVLRPDAPLILLFTGTGSEIPDIKARYRELCAAAGYPARHIGMQDANDLEDFAANIGRRTERFRDRWQWTQSIGVAQALDDMKSRFYSFTNLVPDDIHYEAIEKLEHELREKYNDLNANVDVSTQINLAFVLPA